MSVWATSLQLIWATPPRDVGGSRVRTRSARKSELARRLEHWARYQDKNLNKAGEKINPRFHLSDCHSPRGVLPRACCPKLNIYNILFFTMVRSKCVNGIFQVSIRTHAGSACDIFLEPRKNAVGFLLVSAHSLEGTNS